MQKILIVEDDESISNLIKVNLSAEGYRCTCAFDGKIAADFIEKENFGLILENENIIHKKGRGCRNRFYECG